MMTRIRKMFLGGNTGYGFYSFYEQVVSGESAKTYILKGGPGTGKSSFMRQIAVQLLGYGYSLEEYYCSSDSNSLDGIYIPSLGVFMVDGTAPHVIDPKHPGVVESVIDLADYWDEIALQHNRDAVLAGVNRSSFLFRRAYAYLRLARELNDEIESYIRELGALDLVGLNRVAAITIQELLGNASPCLQPARERHLFASAITPQGLVNHLPTLVAGSTTRVLIRGTAGTGRTTIISKVLAAAQQRNYDVEVYHCALDPERIDHVLIPKLGITICNASEPHVISCAVGDIVIDTLNYVDCDKLAPYVNDLAGLRDAYQAALAEAIAFIVRAHQNHAYLESLYVPQMDFRRVAERRELVLQEILALGERTRS